MEASEIERCYRNLSGSDPATALERFEATLERFNTAGGTEAGRARLLRQAALAARASYDLDRSNALATRGIEEAHTAGDHHAETMLHLTMAYNYFLAGDADAALGLVASLSGRENRLLGATIDFQRATILARLGRLSEAIETLEAANETVKSTDDRYLQLQLLKNLGMARVREGECELAASSTEAARDIAMAQDLGIEAAFCEHNLGLIASHASDLPTAFTHFERAEREIRARSGNDFESKAGHCRALLSAGLFQEAAAMAGAAADACNAAEFRIDGAESRILEAGALLELGNYDMARDRARQARAVFASHDRLGIGATADLLLATIDHRQGKAPDRADLRAIVVRLSETGMRWETVLARLLLIELSTEAGELAEARAELDAIQPDLKGMSADVQLAGATTEATLLAAEGDLAGADRAAIRGFELLIEQQSLLGSADLRVALRQYAGDLGRLGLDLARRSDESHKVVAWIERILVTASTPRPVRPPADPTLRRAVARLRSLEGDDPDERARRENEVRLAARTQRATGWSGHGVGAVDVGSLVEAVGHRAALTIGATDDEIVIGVIGGGSAAAGVVDHRVIGSGQEVAAQLRGLRSDLRRRSTTSGPRRSERILARLQRLDDLLITPLGLGDRELLVAPGAGLSAIPWASLPNRVGHPTTTTTSLTGWARTVPSSARGEVALVAGTDLDHVDDELEAVADVVDCSGSIGRAARSGSAATIEEALAALDGADLAHIVAHGTTRVDNPLFSSLRMADGELNVYELGDLERAPSVVVLSACHVGLPADRPGQELLGMVTGLLSTGTSCVIASTLPVPDSRSTIEIMTRLHRFLAEGMSPAVAWAEVQRTCPDEEQLLDTASFTVFGRG